MKAGLKSAVRGMNEGRNEFCGPVDACVTVGTCGQDAHTPWGDEEVAAPQLRAEDSFVQKSTIGIRQSSIVNLSDAMAALKTGN